MSGRQDSDGDTASGRQKRARARENEANLLRIEAGISTADQAAMVAVCKLFQYFLHRDDGYLKVKREPDSQDVHFTFIWTLGKWTRHYVYVRTPYWDCTYALELLRGKIVTVDEGTRMPTPDRFNR